MPHHCPSLFAGVSFAMLLCASVATAQPPSKNCAREATTSFTFGLTGGTLKPVALELSADGTVRKTGEQTGPVLGTVARKSVATLARRTWRSGFAELPTAPTRPTRNPDVARRFIEIHSACGSHHVEYALGSEPLLFHALYARLNRLTAPITHERP